MSRFRTALFVSILAGILSYAIVIWQTHPGKPAPVVDLGYAQYTGVYKRLDKLNAFYGIRYAKSPSGRSRWREPIPVDSVWNEPKQILNATSRQAGCPGGPMPLEMAHVPIPSRLDEDCLALDIITPASPVASKLPVMVQIHGGGYAIGDASTFPGDALVKHSRNNIVYVAIQYRLGQYGFLAGKAIKADGVWNAGLLDQRAALEWVRRHIDRFGGDPSRVTILGSSAGGGSVAMQMIMYGGEKNPPFQAAIAEFPWWTPPYNESGLDIQYNRLLRTTACSSLSCLRDLPIEELDKAGRTTFKEAREEHELASGLFYWGPTIDGTVLQGSSLKEFEHGHFTKVPLLINRNEFEGIIFTNFSMHTESDVLDDIQIAWPGTLRTTLDKLLQLYPASANAGLLLKDVTLVNIFRVWRRASSLWETFFGGTLLPDAVMQRQSFFGDVLVNCPTNYMANAVSASGQNVYKMIFKAGIRVHGATVGYLYHENTTPSGYYNGRGLISLFLNSTIEAYMRDTMVSFAMHYDPNQFSTLPDPVHWPEFKADSERIVEVTSKNIITDSDPDSNERCEALKVLAR